MKTIGNPICFILIDTPNDFSFNTKPDKEHEGQQVRKLIKYLFTIGLFFISYSSFCQIDTEKVLLRWTGSYVGFVIEDTLFTHPTGPFVFFNIYKKIDGKNIKVEADFRFVSRDGIDSNYLHLDVAKAEDNYLEFESSSEDISTIKLQIDENNIVRGITDDFSFFAKIAGL